MAIQKPTLPKGTRDFGPLDLQKRKFIITNIEDVFKKYGFMPLETPAMENLSTLEGKYGEEGDKLLYRILNSGNFLQAYKDSTDYTNALDNIEGKDIVKYISEKGLRYDLTVPFARYVVMNRSQLVFPFKRYQIQPVWRADRPQKGRYREFWQCDADIVGSESLINELDLISIYHDVFTQLKINYELRVNNRKILAGIAEVVKSIDYITTIAVAIDKLDKIGEEGVRKELVENAFTESELNTLFEIIKSKGNNQFILENLKDKLKTSETGTKGIEELSFLLQNIENCNRATNNNINLKLDFSLARGLSYYTGCIFEVTALDSSLMSSIGGGGRYDNLTENFGLPNVSGVGISFGLDRIYDVMEELNLFSASIRTTQTKILFCFFDEKSQEYCLPAVTKLRAVGIAAEIYPDVNRKKAIVKQLDYANALQIPFAAIAGENEINQNVFTLKNLLTGEQNTLKLDDIIQMLKE